MLKKIKYGYTKLQRHSDAIPRLQACLATNEQPCHRKHHRLRASARHLQSNNKKTLPSAVGMHLQLCGCFGILFLLKMFVSAQTAQKKTRPQPQTTTASATTRVVHIINNFAADEFDSVILQAGRLPTPDSEDEDIDPNDMQGH